MAIPRHLLMETLRRALARCEQRTAPAEGELISTGVEGLDRCLPWGGLRAGSLVEYLAGNEASGAGSLALLAGSAACREGRACVVFDRQRQFYPAAAAALGIELARMIVVRSAEEDEERWAVDQALRCPGVGAVWLRWGRLDARDFRRFQLAAECGGTLGVFVRPAKFRLQPSWSDVQWLVRPAPAPAPQGRRLWVELVRCRGAAPGKRVLLELDEQTSEWREPDHATHSLPVPAQLAHSASRRRQTGA